MAQFDLPPSYRPDPPRLFGSHDPMRAETYFPPRPLSIDGGLRRLETVELATVGRLLSFARLGDVVYGQVDLPEQVRVLAILAPGDYAIGDRCVLKNVPVEEGAKSQWRFARA